jgi:nucleoid-associated protein EbfC
MCRSLAKRQQLRSLPATCRIILQIQTESFSVFKGISNLASLLKQAQQVGSRIQAVNEELRSRRATGKAAGGMVEAEVDGLGQVLRVSIDPSLIERKDRELIEDLVPAAVNAAIAKSKELHAEALRGLTGGMELPANLKEMLGGNGGTTDIDSEDGAAKS